MSLKGETAHVVGAGGGGGGGGERSVIDLNVIIIYGGDG